MALCQCGPKNNGLSAPFMHLEFHMHAKLVNAASTAYRRPRSMATKASQRTSSGGGAKMDTVSRFTG